MKKKKEDLDFLKKTNKTKKKQIDVQKENLMQDIIQTLEPCIKCGMCKSLCPAFAVLRKEEVSPRGHSILLQEKKLTEFLFQCNLCKACEKKCPLNLKICDAVKKARELMVLNNLGPKNNAEMMESIRKTGGPFGSKSSNNPDKLYCC